MNSSRKKFGPSRFQTAISQETALPRGQDGRFLFLRDANGASKAMIVLAADISETVRQKEKIDLLMREVNHRSKNVLSFVQAIAQQTAAKSPGDFVTRFRQRLHALAANQDLLVKNEWKGVPIDELVRTQFAPFEDMIGSRIMFSGRPVWVSARAAQTLGMALYELATNAAKYGALAPCVVRLRLSGGSTVKEKAKPFICPGVSAAPLTSVRLRRPASVLSSFAKWSRAASMQKSNSIIRLAASLG